MIHSRSEMKVLRMIFISTTSKVEYDSPLQCLERLLLSAVLAIFDKSRIKTREND